MSAATQQAVRTTHNVAAEIHRALASSGLSIADLAQISVQSEAFIRSILVGEDGIARLVNMDLLQSFADATGRTLHIKISPAKRRSRKTSVEGSDA